jgi:hypothetical protein
MSDFKPAMIPIPMDRCQHITCKGLLIWGNEYKTPEDESCRTNDFWCTQTQKALGPDGGLVMLSRCNASRGCFEQL